MPLLNIQHYITLSFKASVSSKLFYHIPVALLHQLLIIYIEIYPCLAGVVQLVECHPCAERLPVQFLVRAYTWVLSLIPSWGAYERWGKQINVTLSHCYFSLSKSLNGDLYSLMLLFSELSVTSSIICDVWEIKAVCFMLYLTIFTDLSF